MMLEELRIKEELVNYFKKMGQNITEEEIEILRKSYGQAKSKNGTLSKSQLDNVVGGIIFTAFNMFIGAKYHWLAKKERRSSPNGNGLCFEAEPYERRCEILKKMAPLSSVLDVSLIASCIALGIFESKNPE